MGGIANRFTILIACRWGISVSVWCVVRVVDMFRWWIGDFAEVEETYQTSSVVFCYRLYLDLENFAAGRYRLPNGANQS